ncbi:MAG: hypothetical protein K0Q65_2095, partial [Clostridia bacterium]|nr:hypothetical protein [Clostridia bacterium]
LMNGGSASIVEQSLLNILMKELYIMNKNLFDENSGMLLLDEYICEMPSFRKIMEDSVITSDEVMGQSEKVITLLKRLEGVLQPEGKELLIETLCEIAVLYAISTKDV